ncbi:hypothetical protein [Leucobacter komagatae]|nr:hypothetical protein [Leucobacter komagatae]
MRSRIFRTTVVGDTYVDGPGSITGFSVVEEDGEFYLREVADASNVENIVETTIEPSEDWVAWFIPAPGHTWSEQAENFKKVIGEYGKK